MGNRYNDSAFFSCRLPAGVAAQAASGWQFALGVVSATLAATMLLAGVSLARAEQQLSVDAQWALFRQYAAICKSFHVIASSEVGQDAERLLRDLKPPRPYGEYDCKNAHRIVAGML